MTKRSDRTEPLSPQEAMVEITRLTGSMYEAIKAYEGYLIDEAEKEYEYNRKAAACTLELKAAGTPATLIPQLVKGNTEVAKAKLGWAVSEAMVTACKAKIEGIRADMNGAQSILSYHKEADRIYSDRG